MNHEMQNIINQLKDAYEGDPWFGRSIKKILPEIDINTALNKTGEQHSILELLYHMITWREFVISRLQPEHGKDIQYFEKKDWRDLDQADDFLWQKGIELLDATQQKLLQLLEKSGDSILDKTVDDRKYNFRFLLYGIIQHDIYHLGQIAYAKKMADVIKTNSF